MKATIITDASHCHESGASGFGYWIASDRGRKGGGGSMGRAIKGAAAAEMFAVCNALFIAVKEGLLQAGDHALVQTDCQGAIRAFEGSRLVSNPDEVEAVAYFHNFREEKKFTVSFRHVKGHTTRPEARFVTNTLCDRRAKEGMRKARARLKGK